MGRASEDPRLAKLLGGLFMTIVFLFLICLIGLLILGMVEIWRNVL